MQRRLGCLRALACRHFLSFSFLLFPFQLSLSLFCLYGGRLYPLRFSIGFQGVENAKIRRKEARADQWAAANGRDTQTSAAANMGRKSLNKERVRACMSVHREKENVSECVLCVFIQCVCVCVCARVCVCECGWMDR